MRNSLALDMLDEMARMGVLAPLRPLQTSLTERPAPASRAGRPYKVVTETVRPAVVPIKHMHSAARRRALAAGASR